MKAIVGLIVFVLSLQHINGAVITALDDDENSLVAVAVLFSHGDTSPTTSYPNDPYFNLDYWPMGFGQLTDIGKKRHYQLGKWFRIFYGDILPETYNAKDIYVLSSDVDITLISAEANLAGLYPPKGSQLWNENLPWQPIPVHTIPNDEDQILYMSRPCAKYERLYNETYGSDFFRQINEIYGDFYKEVSEVTGWQIDDVHYFAQLQSVLYVYSLYNESFLPSWSSTLDQVKLNYLAGLNYARYTWTDSLKRLRGGPFFDNLFQKLDKALDETQEGPKFFMYSGHESTVAAVLNGMGVFDNRAPEFASSIIWEVRKTSEGELNVNLFYKKNSDNILYLLRLNGCENDCKYEVFKSLLNPYTLDSKSWDDECEISD